MSKSTLKKHLQSLTKEQVIELVLKLYDAYKPEREYLEHLMIPDEKGLLEKYKSIIINEFFPKGKFIDGKLRFSVAKKAIADFQVLKPSPELLGDLLVTLPEVACQYTSEFGDMTEQYYTSTATNFQRALIFLRRNDLLEHYKTRCQRCVKYAEKCGYGFSDEIANLFFEFYS